MNEEGGSSISIVDVSERPKAWKPHVDAFGKPAEAALYADLVDLASMRLSRAPDGTPRIALVEGDSVALYRVPSRELVELLDRIQLKRHRRLCSEPVLAGFFRLVRARVSDPEFVDDPPFLGPREAWNERRALPSPPSPDIERLLDLLDQLCAYSEGWVARLDDLAAGLSLSSQLVVDLLVDEANVARIRSAGFRVRSFPSALGTVYLVQRGAGEESIIEQERPERERTRSSHVDVNGT